MFGNQLETLKNTSEKLICGIRGPLKVSNDPKLQYCKIDQGEVNSRLNLELNLNHSEVPYSTALRNVSSGLFLIKLSAININIPI